MFDRANSPVLRLLLRSSLLLTSLPVAAHADQWTPPTPEELSMTSQPQVPGAPAVYLFREENTQDNLHAYTVYARIKVLTEGGKRFGDIELKYSAGGPERLTIGDIAGRTIHSDGTIIPFSGKPYEKLIVKGKNYQYKAKVFSMPSVEVGSIIEFRYVLRYDDYWFVPPQWYVQSDLFTRKGHYLWRPTNHQLTNERGQLTNGVSWTNVLPGDAKILTTSIPTAQVGTANQQQFELSVHDIPPSPEEDFMPPISSFTYRVLFYYSSYHTADEFWKSETKFWAKNQDKFIGPGSAVNNAVKEIIPPGDTDEQKLRKLYAAVQHLDNTSFSRAHTDTEDKSEGLREIKNTDDIWLRKRGTDDQLAGLFVAMARAAGYKAYLMAVTDRSRRIFFPQYLSLNQLDDDIAIVNVGGKDVFLDPGTRFCPYGQLSWKHTMTGGVRQLDGGAVIAQTPNEKYTDSRIQRVANLRMETDGSITGNIKMTYMGTPAISWRQQSLLGDEESLKRELHSSLEELLPHTLELKVVSIDKLTDPDEPLTVNYDVKGTLGSPTGKRLIMPGDIFEANAKPTFPHEKRDVGVYFEYGRVTQDAIRVNLPPGFTIESLPTNGRIDFQKSAVYAFSAESAPTNYTIRRNYSLGDIIYLPKDYPQLRTFYSDMETRDQQSVILNLRAATTENASTGGH